MIRGSETTTTRKKVCFAEETKGHDGLCRETRCLDRITTVIFGQRDAGGALTILVDTPEEDKTVIRDALAELLKRLNHFDSSIPVLPRGGGNGFKLNKTHVEAVEWLSTIADSLCDDRVEKE